jgi:hypothetical protein
MTCRVGTLSFLSLSLSRASSLSRAALFFFCGKVFVVVLHRYKNAGKVYVHVNKNAGKVYVYVNKNAGKVRIRGFHTGFDSMRCGQHKKRQTKQNKTTRERKKERKKKERKKEERKKERKKERNHGCSIIYIGQQERTRTTTTTTTTTTPSSLKFSGIGHTLCGSSQFLALSDSHSRPG